MGSIVRSRARLAAFVALCGFVGAALGAFTVHLLFQERLAAFAADGALDHARSIVRYAARGGPTDAEAFAAAVTAAWAETELPYERVDVCVVSRRGRFLVHTGRPDVVGRDAGETRLLHAGTGLETLADLLAKGIDWAGLEGTPDGGEQVVAYAYEPSLGTLVGVHIRSEAFQSWLQRAQMPWLTVLGAVAGLLLPLSLLVLHRSWSRAVRQTEEARRLERAMTLQLARGERLASLGTLAAGLAHEINNPLTYVLGNLEHLEQALPRHVAAADPTRARMIAAVAEAREGAERVARVVRDLRGFARPEGAARPPGAPIEPRAALEQALRLIEHTLRHRARLVRHVEATPQVPGGGGFLEQILVHLLTNAMLALPEDRTGENELTVDVGPGPAPRTVRIAVADNGPGMPPEVLARAFDPFFTTRAPGGGTGLGLFVSKQLAEALGGTLALHSTPGKGTTAVLVLPAASAAEPRPAPAAPDKPRVLMIDDEPRLASTLARLLAPEIELVAETTAGGGLSRLEHDTRFQLVLLDLALPDAPGVDVFEAIRRDHPALASRVVPITGGATDARSAAFLASFPGPVLEKPFRAEAVARLIRDAPT